jgi:hypothetical protein
MTVELIITNTLKNINCSNQKNIRIVKNLLNCHYEAYFKPFSHFKSNLVGGFFYPTGVATNAQ